jgi:hypothetical protein
MTVELGLLIGIGVVVLGGSALAIFAIQLHGKKVP